MKFTYRPDIDGLRAAAVTLVMVYHGYPSALPGGFVGVDIFFVISGFLITAIIRDAQRQGVFSFASFYARRIRRIFPALIIVLGVVYVWGWYWLLPDEMASLGRNTFGGASFVANFVLLGETGYFDVGAAQKPLLHLWSLGVEEQFYIAWPLICWLARDRVHLLRIALALSALSFALNLVMLSGHPVATFYLPFTRIWEILCGAALTLSIESIRPASLAKCQGVGRRHAHPRIDACLRQRQLSRLARGRASRRRSVTDLCRGLMDQLPVRPAAPRVRRPHQLSPLSMALAHSVLSARN